MKNITDKVCVRASNKLSNKIRDEVKNKVNYGVRNEADKGSWLKLKGKLNDEVWSIICAKVWNEVIDEIVYKVTYKG